VRLLRAAKNQFVFQLASREKELFLRLLALYPCLPPQHQPLTKGGRLPDQEASENLLQEALAEQRAEYKQQLTALLAAPRRFQDTPKGCHLSLTAAEIEYLLQILNDIRVGSWVRLGSPEARLEKLDAETAPHLWAMEMAGAFQMHLLGALEGGGGEA